MTFSLLGGRASRPRRVCSVTPAAAVGRQWRSQSCREKTKAVLLAAGLRPELSFTSFRHGGFTELGDAELTDAQIRALSRQKTAKVVSGYVKRTQSQIIEGTHKRRATRPAETSVARGRQLNLFED